MTADIPGNEHARLYSPINEYSVVKELARFRASWEACSRAMIDIGIADNFEKDSRK
jgi:hypothetical protein